MFSIFVFNKKQERMNRLIRKINREFKKDFILKLLEDTDTIKNYLTEKEFFEIVEKKYTKDDIKSVLKEIVNLEYIAHWAPAGDMCYAIHEKGKIKLDEGGFIGDLSILLLWPALIGALIGALISWLLTSI